MVLRKRALLTAGATLTCLGVAACTPAGPSTPTPTPVVTPSETQLERQARLDFEAAEKSYRTATAEFDRLRNQGSRQPSDVMMETSAGPFLKAYADGLKDAYEARIRSTGTTKIRWIERGSFSPEELTLHSCLDGTRIRVYDAQGKFRGTGEVGKSTVTVRLIDAKWKVWSDVLTQDPRCAG